MWHYGVVKNVDGTYSILDSNACKVGCPFYALLTAWEECGRLNANAAKPWYTEAR